MKMETVTTLTTVTSVMTVKTETILTIVTTVRSKTAEDFLEARNYSPKPRMMTTFRSPAENYLKFFKMELSMSMYKVSCEETNNLSFINWQLSAQSSDSTLALELQLPV